MSLTCLCNSSQETGARRKVFFFEKEVAPFFAFYDELVYYQFGEVALSTWTALQD